MLRFYPHAFVSNSSACLTGWSVGWVGRLVFVSPACPKTFTALPSLDGPGSLSVIWDRSYCQFSFAAALLLVCFRFRSLVISKLRVIGVGSVYAHLPNDFTYNIWN